MEVKIFVYLRCRRVYIALVVPDVLVAALVVEPVHEVGPDLSQALWCDDVGLPIVLVGG